MKTLYTIKNFRAFDARGAKFEIAPITILTGCNSSGKSSVAKSLLLLQQFFAKVRHKYRVEGVFNPFDCSMDLANIHTNFGTFDNILHKGKQKKAKTISLSYTIVPLSALAEFSVELIFGGRESDFFETGWLQSIHVKCGKERILDASCENSTINIEYLHLNGVLESSFLRFYLFRTRCNVNFSKDSDYNVYSSKELEEAEEKLNKVNIQYYKAEVDRYVSVCHEKADGNSLYKHLMHDLPKDSLIRLIEDGVMFYFPILDGLRGKSKSEVRSILLGEMEQMISDKDYGNLEIPQIPRDRETLKTELECILSDFEKSDAEDFISYYSKLETNAFNNIVEGLGNNRIGEFALGIDFLKEIRSCCKIAFSDWGPIHTHYMSDGENGKNDSISFEKLYRFFSRLQWYAGNDETDKDYIERSYYPGNRESQHKLYTIYQEYVNLVFSEILFTNLFDNMCYIDNSCSVVKRLYGFDEEKNNLVNTVDRYFRNLSKWESNAKKFKEICWTETVAYTKGNFTNQWLQRMRIANRLEVKNIEGLGFSLLLHKDTSDKNPCSLADEGFGITQLVSFLLYIETSILEKEIVNMEKYIAQKGSYFPEIEPLEVSPTLIIEEPEVGMHPSLQSKLALILRDAYVNYGIHFIIETHSEYLIRKCQHLVAKGKDNGGLAKTDLSMYYINADIATSHKKVWKIDMDDDGCLATPFGPGFLDEADNLAMDLLKEKIIAK